MTDLRKAAQEARVVLPREDVEVAREYVEMARAQAAYDAGVGATDRLRSVAEREARSAQDLWNRLTAALATAGEDARRLDGSRPLPFSRDDGGRMVRDAWVRWARTQPNPKPSWLVPYDELSEADKEADRQIAEAMGRWTLIMDAARSSFAAAPSPSPSAPRAEVDLLALAKFAIRVCREVGGLPDRTSPADNADMMLVTPDELYPIVLDALRQATATLRADAARMREALAPFAKMADHTEEAAKLYSGPESNPENWAKSCEWADLLRARAALSPAGEAMGEPSPAAEQGEKPCHSDERQWIGGNDSIVCRACGAEWDYRKGEKHPTRSGER